MEEVSYLNKPTRTASINNCSSTRQKTEKASILSPRQRKEMDSGLSEKHSAIFLQREDKVMLLFVLDILVCSLAMALFLLIFHGEIHKHVLVQQPEHLN